MHHSATSILLSLLSLNNVVVTLFRRENLFRVQQDVLVLLLKHHRVGYTLLVVEGEGVEVEGGVARGVERVP